MDMYGNDFFLVIGRLMADDQFGDLLPINSPRACSSSTNKEGSVLQAVIVWLTFVLNVSALYMSRVRRYVTTAEFKQLAKTLDIFRMVLACIYFTFVTVAVLLCTEGQTFALSSDVAASSQYGHSRA